MNPDKLYIGVNYHPHDWSEERWKIDIEMMKQAGFELVRLGHLAWDSYEPDNGVYTFEWFDKVMDLFAQAGIGVVLDISTRPAPVWVHELCPGCRIHDKAGQEAPAVRRYMEDVSDPDYQHYALRFARIMVERYKNHPALFAFGLCMLRRAMFTTLYNTDGTVAGVAQKFELEFAPFVTYQFLTIANVVMAVILVAGLMVPFIWIKKYKV